MIMKRAFIQFLFILVVTTFSIQAVASIKIQEFDTAKNIHVIFVEDPTARLTTVTFAFKEVGSATDPHGKEGLTSLMAHLLMERSRGEDGLDKHAIDKELKSIGVLNGINYSVAADNIVYSFKAPNETLKETFDILNLIFTDQRFDAVELNKAQNYDPPEARLATASERGFASKILIHNLFHGHPYAHPAYGTLDGRQSVTLADIKQAAKQKFTRKNLVVSVIGNVSKRTLSPLIDKAFGDLPAGTAQSLPNIASPKLQLSGNIQFIPKSTPQSGVTFGQIGVSPKDPDYLAFLVLNDIISGKPFTSRLWQEVRENRGLVYDIQTEIVHWQNAALLLGGFESENAKVQEVIECIRKEWQEVQTKGVTEAEFKSSKTGLLGGFALNFASPDGVISYLLTSHLGGLPVDYINKRNELLQKVTLEDVNRVAKKWLDAKNLTFVVVGDTQR